MKHIKLLAIGVLCILVLAQLTIVAYASNEEKPDYRKPDLVCSIKSAYDVEYIDIDTTITVTVTNIGTKCVCQKIRLLIEKDNEIVYNKTIAKKLGIGKSKSVVLDWTNKVEKDYHWKVTVDSFDKIKELDETNNYASKIISVLNHHSIGYEYFYHYVGEESAIMKQHNALVNSISGNLFLSPLDLHVNAFQFDLDVKRVYNNQQSHILGPMGYGWTHNHDAHLEIQPSGDVIFVDMDATNHYYTKAGNDYIPPNGIYDRLNKYADGTYKLFILDGTVLKFSPMGTLLEIRDKNDNTLTYTYTANQLTSVSDTSGLSLTFSYNNGLIESITDPINRIITYTYDANQNLIQVTDTKGAITEYGYDEDHRLVTLEDRIDTTLSFTYSLGGGGWSRSDP